jgi:hypothetical protein
VIFAASKGTDKQGKHGKKRMTRNDFVGSLLHNEYGVCDKTNPLIEQQNHLRHMYQIQSNLDALGVPNSVRRAFDGSAVGPYTRNNSAKRQRLPAINDHGSMIDSSKMQHLIGARRFLQSKRASKIND